MASLGTRPVERSSQVRSRLILRYRAFVAWHFKLGWWIVLVLFFPGTVLSVIVVLEKGQKASCLVVSDPIGLGTPTEPHSLPS